MNSHISGNLNHGGSGRNTAGHLEGTGKEVDIELYTNSNYNKTAGASSKYSTSEHGNMVSNYNAQHSDKKEKPTKVSKHKKMTSKDNIQINTQETKKNKKDVKKTSKDKEETQNQNQVQNQAQNQTKGQQTQYKDMNLKVNKSFKDNEKPKVIQNNPQNQNENNAQDEGFQKDPPRKTPEEEEEEDRYWKISKEEDYSDCDELNYKNIDENMKEEANKDVLDYYKQPKGS